jgi:hypothetical protein
MALLSVTFFSSMVFSSLRYLSKLSPAILVSMNTPADSVKLFGIIQMLYGLMGLQFSDEAAPMLTHAGALKYFLHSFITDFGEIIRDYIAEERQGQQP